jgi:hypothetical protein
VTSLLGGWVAIDPIKTVVEHWMIGFATLHWYVGTPATVRSADSSPAAGLLNNAVNILAGQVESRACDDAATAVHGAENVAKNA